MSEKRGKVKAVKAWCISDDHGLLPQFAGTEKKHVADLLRDGKYIGAKNERIVRVLITPITPKQRRKTK